VGVNSNSSNIGTELLARFNTAHDNINLRARACGPWDHRKAITMVPSLPEEILALVLEEFALPINDIFGVRRVGRDVPRSCMTALSNACLASSMMYRLAWPILYRYYSNRKRSMGTVRRPDPARFLQTICTKPEHEMALRSLQIAECAPIDAMDPLELFEDLQSDATLVDLFQWRARSFWPGEDQISPTPPGELRFDGSLKSALLRSLEMGRPEAHMAMLMLLSPNLRTLDIRAPPHFETSIIARLLDTALSKGYQAMQPPSSIHDPEQEESDYAVAHVFGASWPAPPLQKPNMLQDLVKCAISGSSPSGLRFFKNLISLPTLQQVILCDLEGGYENAISDLEINAPCRRLRNLTLHSCRLLTNEAAAIVQCCPELATLEISWRAGFDWSRSQSSKRDLRLKFGVIADAIAAYTPGLTSLRLSASEWRPRHFSAGYPYTIGRSLQ